MAENSVGTVAAWIGLITGIVGIVLAGVAIFYAYVTNRRADQVNDATIRALAHIESDVDKLSSDVRSLIQDAWAKFVTASGGVEPETTDPESAAEVSQPAAEANADTALDPALTEELKTEIAEAVGQKVSAELQRQLDQTVDNFQRRTQGTAEAPGVGRSAWRGRRPRAAQSFAATLDTVLGLSTQAQELLRVLSGNAPLTRAQYRELAQGELGPRFHELRARGLLGPLAPPGTPPDGAPRYGLPPGRADAIQGAIRVSEPNPAASDQVRSRLRAAGYPAPAAGGSAVPPRPAI